MGYFFNIKKGIDLPIYQWLRDTPASSAAGASMCTDERGTDRFIYMLINNTNFWRYDTYTDSYQQLANPPTITFAAGCSIVFDPSRNYIWLFAPLSTSPYAVFAYYNISTDTWTTRSVPSGLSAQWGTDGCLIHTCTQYSTNGNDDIIYLTGNNSTTWYKYSVSGDTWTTMSASLPVTAAAGHALVWTWGYNSDRIYFIAGGGRSNMYYYSISGGSFSSDISYVPKTETFTTGTCVAYDTRNRIYIVKDATHRIYYYQLDENKMYPAGKWPYASGGAIVGDGLVYIKTDEQDFIYYRIHSGTTFFRMPIGWF